VGLEADAATIRLEALPVLGEAADLLGGDAPVVITVDPPTDEHHGDTYRQLLRRRRANAIRRYLVEEGIAPDRIAYPPDAGFIIAAADASHSRPMELHVP
jgi:outer membrane protein OmpA-like peptidoglycan-associated protein